MVLHIEGDYCDSGFGRDDVNGVAFSLAGSYAYTSHSSKYDFKCPTCATPFRFMSGLLQHAESEACREAIESSILGDFVDEFRDSFGRNLYYGLY